MCSMEIQSLTLGRLFVARTVSAIFFLIHPLGGNYNRREMTEKKKKELETQGFLNV